MIKLSKVLATVTVVLALAGCASPSKVYYDSDPLQDFSEYSTFAWIDDAPMTADGDYAIGPFVERRIMQAIRNALTNKGYRFVEDVNDADLAVAFTVGARNKVRVQVNPGRWYGPYAGPNARWGYNNYFGPQMVRSPDEVTVRQTTTGALSIDLFDTKRRSPVWHSVGSKRLSNSDLRNSTKGMKTIDQDVATILGDLPAK